MDVKLRVYLWHDAPSYWFQLLYLICFTLEYLVTLSNHLKDVT